MPPRGVTGRRNARQYEHIKDSELKQGRSTKRATQIAAATVNKRRAAEGKTKTAGSRKTSSRAAATRKTSSRKSSGRKKSAAKKR